MKTKNNFVDQFWQIYEAWREKTVSAEGSLQQSFDDLSVMQVQVIRIIANHNPCTMSQIAKSSNLSLGNITQIIDKLITKKYVTRIRSTTDRRIVFAKLMAKGEKIIIASKSYVGAFTKQIMNKLTANEQEQFLDLLQKMIK